MGSVVEYLDNVPEDLRPLVASLIDSIAGGLIDNSEQIIENLLAGEYENSYQDLLEGLPTDQLVNMLNATNARMAQIKENSEVVVNVKHVLLKELLSLAFSFLRTEVEKAF